MSFLAAALALLIERYIGYPQQLYRWIGHPVQWIGKLISWLDFKFNLDEDTVRESRNAGILTVFVICLVAAVAGVLVHLVAGLFPFGRVIEIIIGTSLLSQKSLRDHVVAVATAFKHSLPQAQAEVGKIVGRDTTQLDESGVTRAALESLAENSSDGIVAPALWFALLGLPGLFMYKAINTADSMIGHKTRRYLHFGWAAAKLDDLINWPAARLTGFLIALAARFSGLESAKARMKLSMATMMRDASKHNSPNAGWPEAAMAGALGLAFGGPRSYDGDVLNFPWLGDGRKSLSRADIASGLSLFDRAMKFFTALLFGVALVLLLPSLVPQAS